MPKFSIVVPTADRKSYLLDCLKTLMLLPGDDYEIVIQDNGSRPSLSKTVKLPNVRYFYTKPVGMRQNWENAISNARGEYITVLGDDDGFMPDGLDIVRRVIEEHAADIVTWNPHVYWWPDAPIEHKRNLLYINQPDRQARPITPLITVKQFMQNQELFAFEQLPMIYNSFVRRSVVDEVIRRDGKYLSWDIPDVWSGIVNGTVARDGLFLGTPVTMRGIGGKSSGAGTRGKDYKKAYAALRKAKVKYCHEAFIESMCLAIHVNSVKAAAAEKFPVFGGLHLDVGKLIENMLYEVAENPDRKDEIRLDIERVAEKFNFSLDPSIFDREIGSPHRSTGWKNGCIVADASFLNVKNIFDATQCAHMLVGDT